ncbi:MAG: hypothetical protein ACYDA3_09735 [Gaiellaceae bacterium]
MVLRPYPYCGTASARSVACLPHGHAAIVAGKMRGIVPISQ